MSAIGVYLSACRFVVQCNPRDQSSWPELERHLRALRQSLTCCICGLIIRSALVPPHASCPHQICGACKGGKMRLKPACGWCGDQEDFVASHQVDILVQSFKKLCDYVASFVASDAGPLHDLIIEGVGVEAGASSVSAADIAVIPPCLEKQETEAECSIARPAKKHKRAKRNSLKVRINLRKVEGREVVGSSRYVEDNSRHNGSCSADTSHNEVSTTTLTPDQNDLEQDQPHSTTNADLHLEESDSCDDGMHGNDNSIDYGLLNEPPDLNAYNDISDPAFRDIYSTVAVEHDYINRGILSDDEKDSALGINKVKSKGPLVTIIKKTKILDVENLHSEDAFHKNNAPKVKSRSSKKGSGCRCGLATPNPGKLTCCGQRCPCYSAFKGCVDCRCRGCRNPRGDISKHSISPLLSAHPKVTEDSDLEEVKID